MQGDLGPTVAVSVYDRRDGGKFTYHSTMYHPVKGETLR